MDDTLDEEDQVIFDEPEEQNSPLFISFSWWRLFFKIRSPTTGWQRVARLRYISGTTTNADCYQALVFILVLGSKALYCGQVMFTRSLPTDIKLPTSLKESSFSQFWGYQKFILSFHFIPCRVWSGTYARSSCWFG